MDPTDVTNEIRRRRGKPPVNPFVIEGFERGPDPVPQPNTEPIDLGDDPPPEGAVRVSPAMTARELVAASTPANEPGLIILDSAARHGQREVTLGEVALRKIVAIVLLEMKRQVNAELKALDAATPKREKRKKS